MADRHPTLEKLRREARKLARAHQAGENSALVRLRQHPPKRGLDQLKHADYLFVIAQEYGFASWPRLKFDFDLRGWDSAHRQQRLKIALYHGQNWVVDRLLSEEPEIAKGAFGLEVALLDRAAVAETLARDPDAATRLVGPRRPILHLAFSKRIHAVPEKRDDMIAIAEMLVAHGADVNDGFPFMEGSDHLLSALYGALGHANNMVLAEWLLDHGADPNDNESLYHSTELGHHEGLKLLLAHGAKTAGTNALLRAMDFNDHRAVSLLLEHGANPNEFSEEPVGGEAPFVIPALHQAARRMCDREMAELLLDAGADPNRFFKGATPYAFACVYGNQALVDVLQERGAAHELSESEQALSALARGQKGNTLDPEKILPAYEQILREILALPDKFDHVVALVEAGLPFDAKDNEGLTPVQVAGWEGLPEMVAYFLALGPDLTHVNNFGGDLLSTIVHGSENCPARATRDHAACLALALDAGCRMAPGQVALVGDSELAEMLLAANANGA